MALERGIPDFWIWLLGDPVQWSLLDPSTWGFLLGTVAICLLLLLVAPFICFVITSLQYGPSEAFYYVARAMFSAVTEDLPRFSPRRTFAVAKLAVQEAIRNRVLVGFGVFIVLLLFAGLFLDVRNSNPSHTVVTKPIRASEIVLGRTLGFAAVGTAMLVAMGIISYIFVTRGLSHDHEVDVASLIEEKASDGKVVRVRGETTLDNHHRHSIELGPDGKGRTNVVQGHYHEIERLSDGKFRVGPPQGHLIAKAPIYGKLVIYDREGKPGKGISVGNEWEYRGYIEGGTPGAQTKAHAVWTFDGITEQRYPNGLPLELNLRVFRTYKGNIERIIPKELNSEIGGTAGAGTVNLFRDLVDDHGMVEVEVRCVDPAQYFGVAEPDVYLRPGDASFEVNFCKAYLSIWLQMLLVTAFGVTFSTFLSGPVALMASISAIVLGFFGQFVRDIATGVAYGGGPIESFIRIIIQANLMTDLELNSILVKIIKVADGGLMHLLQAATYILPDYTQFDTTEFVATGFNIFGALVAEQLSMAVVYFTVVTVVGYFFLKTREIAA
jgi:hypothetical protein